MAKKTNLLLKKEEKETFKVVITKDLAEEIKEFQKEINAYDKSIVLDYNAVCEEALKKALKASKKEFESLKTKNA